MVARRPAGPPFRAADLASMSSRIVPPAGPEASRPELPGKEQVQVRLADVGGAPRAHVAADALACELIVKPAIHFASGDGTRTWSVIQLVSQVLPPSVEKACSKCAEVGVTSDQT